MNGIKVFGENFVNGDCGYTFSSGDSGQAYLYDQNQATKWTSSGSNDTTEESIIVIFKNWQGEEVNRTFDRIILLETNFAQMAADYWDGSAWQVITEAGITLAADHKLVEIASAITASRFRLRCTTVQSGTDKALGELKVCAAVLDSPRWESSFSRRDEKKGDSYRLAEGSLVSWKEWTKVEGTLSLDSVARADMELLLPFMKTAAFLTLVLHDDFDLADCYEFAVSSAPRLQLDRKTELYDLSMELAER